MIGDYKKKTQNKKNSNFHGTIQKNHTTVKNIAFVLESINNSLKIVSFDLNVSIKYKTLVSTGRCYLGVKELKKIINFLILFFLYHLY